MAVEGGDGGAMRGSIEGGRSGCGGQGSQRRRESSPHGFFFTPLGFLCSDLRSAPCFPKLDGCFSLSLSSLSVVPLSLKFFVQVKVENGLEMKMKISNLQIL